MYYESVIPIMTSRQQFNLYQPISVFFGKPLTNESPSSRLLVLWKVA